MDFKAKFQRDLNRIVDSDRNTRKKGLEKLCESLPWTSKKEREALLLFCYESLLKPILLTVSDSVEKCREYSLKMLKELANIWQQVDYEVLVEITNRLCDRVNDSPFPEVAEALRLLIAEILLQTLLKGYQMKALLGNVEDVRIETKLATTLPKFLTDNYPNVKRAVSEVVCQLMQAPNQRVVAPYMERIIAGLEQNAVHQHAKTRSMSIQALKATLTCLSSAQKYEKCLADKVIPLFQKLLSDRSSSVKLELAEVLQGLVDYRIGYCQRYTQPLHFVDFQLIVMLLILQGDEIEEIVGKAKQAVARGLRHWQAELLPLPAPAVTDSTNLKEEGVVIDDAEIALREIQISMEAIAVGDSGVVELEPLKLQQFFLQYLTPILAIILEGTDTWTNQAKIMYISSLTVFIRYTGGTAIEQNIDTHFQKILSTLSFHIRDEEHEVRKKVEYCVQTIGTSTNLLKILPHLLPAIVPSSDSSSSNTTVAESISQKAGSIRVLTEIIRGYKIKVTADKEANTESGDSTVSLLPALEALMTRLVTPGFIMMREVAIREANILFLRAMIDCFSEQIHHSVVLQQTVGLFLLYLRARFPYEEDTVAEVAQREFIKYATIVCPQLSTTNTEELDRIDQSLTRHYLFYFQAILLPERTIPSLSHALLVDAAELRKTLSATVPLWEHLSPAKAAFETLLLCCPSQSWVHMDLLLPIFVHYIQPKAPPVQGSTEANMLSYASQRGEEKIPTLAEIDIRLNFMIALENLIRYLSTSSRGWEISAYLTTSCAAMMKQLIIPNLIWRVGRVEATIRKIALAICYHILKSGAVSTEILAGLAGDLVPLLVSHLDDSEASIRLMTCFSLTVVFDRLPQLFAEQSVNDLYPKLIARLDDHSDELRIAICMTIEKFFHCGVTPRYYHNTMMDYILTQLFIHLDDSNEQLQQAIAKLISFIGKTFPEQEETVAQRAETNRLSHRSPKWCDMILFEVKGIEILN